MTKTTTANELTGRVKYAADRIAADFNAVLIGAKEVREGWVLTLKADHTFTVNMDRNGNTVCDDDDN